MKRETWRERIARMQIERRGPNDAERALLSNYRTCFVGEQVHKGGVPRWWRVTYVWSHRYDTLYALAQEAAYAGTAPALETLLNKVEDEAGRLKCHHELPR